MSNNCSEYFIFVNFEFPLGNLKAGPPRAIKALPKRGREAQSHPPKSPLPPTTPKPTSRAASKAPKTAPTPATRSQPSRGATTPIAESSGGKKRKAGEIALPPKTYQKTAAGKRTEILQEGEERAEPVTSIILTDEYLLPKFKVPFEPVRLPFSFSFLRELIIV